MDFFIQQLINAFSLGSMYALIAIGYTLVYGVLRLINFAHGDFMMVGAFLVYIFIALFKLNFFVAVGFALIVTSLVGVLSYRVAYKPLLDKDAPKISLLITAIGISFFLESFFNLLSNQLLGENTLAFIAPEFFSTRIEIGNVSFSLLSAIVPLLTLFILAILLFVLYKTKIGIAIRALAFDIFTVKLMGIDSNKIIAFVFALGAFLAGVGGILYAIAYPSISPYMGLMIGLKAFAAAVVGGIGSVSGAVIGGFILGVVEVVIPGFFPEVSGYKDAFAFILLIFVLLFKPTGIMGIDFEKKRF